MPSLSSAPSATFSTTQLQALRAQVDDQNHADLFWGLRGGGGNFGVVTSFEFNLYPVTEICGGFVAYPLAQGKGPADRSVA